MFCTYLTIYSGNKLPPFYIGYTSIENIEKGYRGSVSSRQYKIIWIKELSENPHLFKTIILNKFETKAEAKETETRLQTSLKVHKNPLYINKSISGTKFHSPEFTKETKAKISSFRTGRLHSEETKEKMRIKANERNQNLKLHPKCKICDKDVLRGKFYCSYECSSIASRKAVDTHTIYRIWLENGKNFSKTSRIVGISDNGIRKRFKIAGLIGAPSES